MERERWGKGKEVEGRIWHTKSFSMALLWNLVPETCTRNFHIIFLSVCHMLFCATFFWYKFLALNGTQLCLAQGTFMHMTKVVTTTWPISYMVPETNRNLQVLHFDARYLCKFLVPVSGCLVPDSWSCVTPVNVCPRRHSNVFSLDAYPPQKNSIIKM